MTILAFILGLINLILLLGVIGLMQTTNNKLENIMATLQDVLSDVAGESTVIDSLSALISGLQQQLKDALSGTTLPPAVQAQVDQIFNQAEANKTALASAMVAGTPAAAVSVSAAPADTATPS